MPGWCHLKTKQDPHWWRRLSTFLPKVANLFDCIQTKAQNLETRFFATLFERKRSRLFFVTQNEDIKASIVERFNRTLKEKLCRYLTKKNTLRYVEVLQQMVRAYNRSYHRSIKKAPADVYTTNQEEVWQTLYGQPPDTFNKQRAKLKVGDRVRISKARRTFKKGYLPSWTEELFTISRRKKTTPPTYVLKDDNGELEGTFYQEEVQKVGDKQLYRIETAGTSSGSGWPTGVFSQMVWL